MEYPGYNLQMAAVFEEIAKWWQEKRLSSHEQGI